MEPRVSNLIQIERDTSEHHGLDHLSILHPSAAVFPSNVLPAIRPRHEDGSLESRDYRNEIGNEIDSLQLRTIDWDSLQSPLHPPPSSTSIVAAGAAYSEEQQPLPARTKKSAKSGAPLAKVLNSVSPEVRNTDPRHIDPALIFAYPHPEPRKRRRIDEPGTRILPKPSPAKSKGANRQPRLPPLLVPLHDPPQDARIIPSITTEGFRERRRELPLAETSLRAVEQEQVTTPPKSTHSEKIDHPVVAEKEKPAKVAKSRKRWTDEETADLVKGVSRFGIGSWKKILQHEDYHFNSRTAVDLKDRFRTCFPDQYRSAASGKTQSRPDTAKQNPEPSGAKSLDKAAPAEKSRAAIERKLPEEIERLGISGPFPKSKRRERRGFTAEEDEAILRGFEKYGAQWMKIRSDADLGLASRGRTDLRDRFRNKYPDKFVEAGHKFKLKEAEQPKEDKEVTSEATNKTVEEAPPISRWDDHEGHSNLNSILDPPLSAHKDRAQHSLKLLTASMSDPYFNELDDLTSDADDPQTITLSRNIMDWADQRNRESALPKATEDHHVEPSNTITSADQFNINPMLALKMPRFQSSASASSSTTTNWNWNWQSNSSSLKPVPNAFPPLPLSGILNGPVSLPPPADLVGGQIAYEMKVREAEVLMEGAIGG